MRIWPFISLEGEEAKGPNQRPSAFIPRLVCGRVLNSGLKGCTKLSRMKTSLFEIDWSNFIVRKGCLDLTWKIFSAWLLSQVAPVLFSLCSFYYVRTILSESLAQASGSIVKELQRFSLTCGEQFPPNILVHSRIFSFVLELILWFNWLTFSSLGW